MLNVGIIGCGFVADSYARTMANYHNLRPTVVCDLSAARARDLSQLLSVPYTVDISRFLSGYGVELVVNLTPPAVHADVTSQSIEAGMHVYSEKPMATDYEQAVSLLAQATRKGTRIASAPCTSLGEHAQTLWREIRGGSIGVPRLVYAEVDDGPLHRMNCQSWINTLGVHWPAKAEFELGCIWAHAAYPLSWLTSFFGPVSALSAFSGNIASRDDTDLNSRSPNFATAVLQFGNGIHARLTCGAYARRNHGFTVFGDEGTISVEDAWNFRCPVLLERLEDLRQKNSPNATSQIVVEQALCPGFEKRSPGANDVDFSRGVAEFADAIINERPSRLEADLAVHIIDIQEMIQSAGQGISVATLRSSFSTRPTPLPWAQA